MPCPTSSAVSHNSPGAGRSAGDSSSGSSPPAAHQRAGSRTGASSHTAASPASSNGSPLAGASTCTAAGQPSNHSMPTDRARVASAASHSIGSPAPATTDCSAAPVSASGVTSPDTSGIASRLTSGPTSEVAPKNSPPSGISATVIANCVDSISRQRTGRWRPGRRSAWNQTIAATAANDSQKPAASGAHGSNTAITAALVSSTDAIERPRPLTIAAPASASIQQVRCAGMPQPASAEYPKAVTTAAIHCAI